MDFFLSIKKSRKRKTVIQYLLLLLIAVFLIAVGIWFMITDRDSISRISPRGVESVGVNVPTPLLALFMIIVGLVVGGVMIYNMNKELKKDSEYNRLMETVRKAGDVERIGAVLSSLKRNPYPLKGDLRFNYDYLFFMGDFNCGDNSDVIRMLLGECTLYGTEANPQFFDLAAGYARISGIPARDTLDFFNNPRYKKNSIEVSSRADRIFLQNTFPNELPAVLMCDIFGTEVYEEIGLAASDHYGVYAKVGF